MFCPECRAEYREGVTTCPDCGVTLIPELPAVSELTDEDLVAVLDTGDVSILPVVKSVLRAAGIPYLVQGDESMGVLPVGKIGVAGISSGGHGLAAMILVPRDREEEARALLTELAEGEEGEGIEV